MMKNHHRAIITIVAAAFLAQMSNAATPATPTASAAQPAVFEWNYKYEPDPGQRTWSYADNVWTEKLPSGDKVRYKSDGKLSIHEYNMDFHGTLVHKVDDKNFEVFVPDLDNKFTWLFFRRDGGAWQFLSGITPVK